MNRVAREASGEAAAGAGKEAYEGEEEQAEREGPYAGEDEREEHEEGVDEEECEYAEGGSRG
jgi:hypothetical protein